jgi:G3E family GTPase
VITGFLGSGKTTLLARLLRDPALARTAVIVNEFGEVGLDHLLVEASDEEIVLLDSGCVCCSVRGDLVRTAESLLARRAAGTIAPFERIVIETTGLADPAPILQALMTDPAIADSLVLEAVIATVDAAAGAATLDAHPESVKQAAIADRIVVTKTDLSDPAANGLVERLRALNPAAPRLTAVHGAVDASRLLAAECTMRRRAPTCALARRRRRAPRSDGSRRATRPRRWRRHHVLPAPQHAVARGDADAVPASPG